MHHHAPDQVSQQDALATAPCRLAACLWTTHTTPALRRTVQQLRDRVDALLVVGPEMQRDLARECQTLGVPYVTDPGGEDASAARNAAIDAAQADWLLWLEPGESLNDNGWASLREIARADAAQLPPAFAVEVVTPGSGPHAYVDAVVRDEIRLHQRRAPLRFQNGLVPRLGPVTPGITCGWLEIAVEQPPGHGTPWKAHAHRLHEDGEFPPSGVATGSELFDAGMMALQRGDRDRAETLFSASLAPLPPHLFARQAYATLLAIHLRSRRVSEARQLLERAKIAYPHDSELLFREGVLYQSLGHWQRALGSFREAARCGQRVRDWSLFYRRIPTYEAPHNRAVVLAQLGRMREAEQQWREVVEIAPQFVAAWAALTDLLLREERTVEAAALAHVMQQQETPLLGLSLVVQSRVYQQSGDLAASRCCLEQAVRYAPHDLVPLREMLLFFAKHGPTEEIEPILQELQRRDEGDSATAYNTGTLYLRLGRLEQAVTALEEAIRRDPAHGPAHHNLARLYEKLGWGEKAERAATTARTLHADAADLGSSRRFLSEVSCVDGFA